VAVGIFVVLSLLLVSNALTLSHANLTQPAFSEAQWFARPLHFAEPAANYAVAGYSPNEIRAAYNLPSSGGDGTTIAVIVAYDTPTIQADLAVFCNQYGLPMPTSDNFEIRKMSSRMTTNDGWATETALDVEWAHAIAPQAKILLVEARSPALSDMLEAIDYATSRPEVVAVTMSWGDEEFSREAAYDYRLTSASGAGFFASSGDNGAGVLWPASSINVVAVGGTTLVLNADGSVSSETAWSGSGGGVSAYENIPDYQATYGLSSTKRSVPDVSYNADPKTGFAVYNNGNWYRIGGTSAGAPQWAAIYALEQSAANPNLYLKAKSSANATYFRDINSGSNGAYTATADYDLVTGLGSPLTADFAPSSATVANTVTLVQAGQSTPLDAQNQFAVSYVQKGMQKVAYASNGTLTVSADPDSDLTVSGVSTGSSAQERWVLNAGASSVTGTNLTLYYYDLVAQTVNYAVTGGGTPPSPVLSYVTAPSVASGQQTTQSATLSLSLNLQTAWALKGSEVTVSNPLSAGTSERWITETNSSSVQTAGTLSVFYQHQYALLTSGADQTGTQWYDSGETAQVTVSGVFGRAAGAGYRVTSYTLDNGNPVQMESTLQTTTVAVTMNAAHQLELNSVRQYQISLDAAATETLDSLTPPTINGDSYWYDEGTQVTLTLNGVANRAAGAGQRIATVSLNGASSSLATVGVGTVLDEPLFSAQTVSAALVNQYQLSISSGSLNSVTPPSIIGDAGWYDQGNSVTVTVDHSWNLSQAQSRFNAVSYKIGQNPATAVTRAGNGTFTLQVAMDKSQTVAVSSVTQYKLQISGVGAAEFSQQSPTDDGFFDSGATVTVTAPALQLQAEGASRNRLVSYTLDNAETEVPQTQVGNVAVTVTFDRAHQLTFNSVEQFLVSFQFTDHDGNPIVPSRFELQTASVVVEAPQFSVWVDSGTQLQVRSVIWQNAEVKPAQQASYVASGAVNETVQCRVFNAQLSVKDYLGLPVSGAQVTVALANQTVINTVTGGDGTVSLSRIPVGTFQATATYLGTTATIQSDASTQPVTAIKVFASLPTVGLIAAVSALTVAVVVVLAVRRCKVP
jgi:hypothetical protein